ncbi:MAG: thermonuclease family protein [Pirellulales bacterium]
MKLVRVRDTDTVEVQVVGGSLIWAVRLLDVWAPELRRGDEESKQLAREGKAWLESYLAANADSLRLHVPLPDDRNILKSLTFDRVVGTLWSGTVVSVNQKIVEYGFASSTKGGPLGSIAGFIGK